jgi:hypothetical protein
MSREETTEGNREPAVLRWFIRSMILVQEKEEKILSTLRYLRILDRRA